MKLAKIIQTYKHQSLTTLILLFTLAPSPAFPQSYSATYNQHIQYEIQASLPEDKREHVLSFFVLDPRDFTFFDSFHETALKVLQENRKLYSESYERLKSYMARQKLMQCRNLLPRHFEDSIPIGELKKQSLHTIFKSTQQFLRDFSNSPPKHRAPLLDFRRIVQRKLNKEESTAKIYSLIYINLFSSPYRTQAYKKISDEGYHKLRKSMCVLGFSIYEADVKQGLDVKFYNAAKTSMTKKLTLEKTQRNLIKMEDMLKELSKPEEYPSMMEEKD